MTAFLDTNILLYAVGDDPDEQTKRDHARDVISAGDIALSVQVFQEFFWQSTRPHRGPKLIASEATAFLQSLRRWPVQEMTLALFDDGLAIMRRHKISFWDSLIVAAAKLQGCDTLLSEDMQDGAVIDGVTIRNPFT